VCAKCHIPHASGGDRLWVEDPVSGTVTLYVGAVAKLCGYCHKANQGGDPNTTNDPWSDDFVYGANSHGRLMSDTNLPMQMASSGLPYHAGTGDGNIECTTCHDPHNDPSSGQVTASSRPFLRANLEVLCSGCHGDRRLTSGSGWQEGSAVLNHTGIGAWGASTGLGNPGSHPVGTDITQAGASTTAVIRIPAIMKVAWTDTAGYWSLGGHLTETENGVVCVTCHSVHGTFVDIEHASQIAAWNGSDTPNPNFLAVSQRVVQSSPRSVANGDSAWNPLCEACHMGPEPVAAGYGTVEYNTTTTYHAPNPGATSYGHPVDDMNADAAWPGLTSFPNSDTPQGGVTGDATTGIVTTPTNVDPIPICESCHAPHVAADATRADFDTFTPAETQYILRGSVMNICDPCHDPTGSGSSGGGGGDTVYVHHPVGGTFEGDPVLYLSNVSSGSNTVGCYTCHNGGDGGGDENASPGIVHNWIGSDVPIDPNWKPEDNARQHSQYDSMMSMTCMDCHYGMDGDSTTKSPTQGNGISDEPQYGVIGNGTHFIGAFSTSVWAEINPQSSPNNNPQIDTWPDGGQSRFGGDASNPVLVCESCHELEPDHNNGNKHLLLGAFAEETAPQASSRSTFCEFCHLPPGTHPQTGDTVSRTNNTMSTDLALSWLRTPTDTNIVITDDLGILNCDTCHQVHDANTESFTFILDTAEANVGTHTTLSYPTYNLYTATYVTPRQMGVGGDHAKLCAQCHPYE
jgi:predicted CXXCH cytochrome family protein